MFDQIEGVGPVAAPRAAAALRLGRARARGDAGGAGGRARRAGEDGAPDLRAAPPRRPRLSHHRVRVLQGLDAERAVTPMGSPSAQRKRRGSSRPGAHAPDGRRRERSSGQRASSRPVRPRSRGVRGRRASACRARPSTSRPVDPFGSLIRGQRRADHIRLGLGVAAPAGVPALHDARACRDAAAGRIAGPAHEPPLVPVRRGGGLDRLPRRLPPDRMRPGRGRVRAHALARVRGGRRRRAAARLLDPLLGRIRSSPRSSPSTTSSRPPCSSSASSGAAGRSDAGSLWAFALLLGLALTNQQTIVLLVPGFLVLGWAGRSDAPAGLDRGASPA